MIVKRNGKYQVRYFDGLGNRPSKTVDTKREAQAFEDQMRQELRRGEYIAPKTSRPLARRLQTGSRPRRTVAPGRRPTIAGFWTTGCCHGSETCGSTASTSRRSKSSAPTSARKLVIATSARSSQYLGVSSKWRGGTSRSGKTQRTICRDSAPRPQRLLMTLMLIVGRSIQRRF